MQFAWGYAPTMIIEAALKVGLFDALARGPMTLPQTALACTCSLRGMKALMNALVGLRLLGREGESYTLTQESEAFLVSTKPDYRGLFFHHHRAQLVPQWMQLEKVVRTGQCARATNKEDDGARHFAAFVESLFPVNLAAAVALGKHLRVEEIKSSATLLDVGAGSGVWGISLAHLSPLLRIHAVDWPEVLEITRKMAAKHGLADRLTTSAGDFYEADFGKDHLIATLGHILHSEGPSRIQLLLQKTYASLAPGGVIAIQEWVPDEDRKGPAEPLLFAVNMLVNTEEGDTYTFMEISQWLREAGFENPRLLKVPAVSPLILADKPSIGQA